MFIVKLTCKHNQRILKNETKESSGSFDENPKIKCYNDIIK